MSERLPVRPDPASFDLMAAGGGEYPAPFRSPESEEEGGGLQVGRILAALLRFKWVLAIAVAVGGAGAYLAYRSIAPTYQAEGQFWINVEDPRSQMAGPISQSELLPEGAWIDLLRSYAVLDPVVVKERLYIRTATRNQPLFADFFLAEQFLPGSYILTVSGNGARWTLTTADRQSEVASGVPGDPIGDQAGFLWTPSAELLTPGLEVEFTVVHPRDAASQLANGLVTRPDRTGVYIWVGYGGTDPQRITTILEAVMQQYVTLAAELKRGKLDELTEILREQLATVQTELETAERQLESFRVRTVTLPSEQSAPIAPGLEQTRAPVLTDYFNRRIEAEALSRDVERLAEVLDSIPQGGVRVEALELIPSVANSSQLQAALQELTDRRAELRALLRTYTEDYQPVRNIQQEIDDLETVTIPRLTRSLMAELMARQSELQQVLSARGDELQQIPPRAIEENRLERQVAIADDFYQDLRQRYATAELAAKSSIADVSILSHPRVPTLPSSDQRLPVAGMIFLGALGLGVLGVVFADRLDPRFRYISEVSDKLGLEILGVVPRLRTGRKENSHAVFEAFRDIRMRTEFAHGPTRPIVVAVTSPDQHEGKTFVSANLGIAFAQLGRATLLVDGDTRRGDLHDLFDKTRKPGLTDLLEGRARQSVIVSTEHENLDLLPSGSRRTASPELLSSGRMQQILAALKPRYDVIIIDSPPMAAGSDAFVLGAHAGNLVLVMRSGSTNKELARGKLETFLRLPVRLLGGILNDVEEREAAVGYYRHYSYYLPDYVPGNDEPLPETEGEKEHSTPLLP